MNNRQPLLIAVVIGVLVSVNLSAECSAFLPVFPGRRYSKSPLLGSNMATLHSVHHEEVAGGDSAVVPDLSDDFQYIRHYSELAIQKIGTSPGLEALRLLAAKSQQRVPYNFDEDGDHKVRRSGSVVSHFQQLLQCNVTQAFLNQVQEMESNGWISINPDSVDGLPSLHLNLVSHGLPKVAPGFAQNDFERGLEKLLALVEDPIYKVLLPNVRQLLNTSSIQVSDIFLRRYGQDVCDVTRRGISAHYDVFSRVTSVIAMDDVAADGRNGLFTTYLSPCEECGKGATSNHAAMRRFFPLKCGDGVVHTWDILHGVDVEPHLDRTSLIVWFTQEDSDGKQTLIAPWLPKSPTNSSSQCDDVADFVLASALSSVEESGFDPELVENERHDYPSVNELYLRSAEYGNTFALMRVGSLIEGEAFDEGLILKAAHVADKLRESASLPEPIRSFYERDSKSKDLLAMRFWLEGAVRGNPLAQRALADELMMYASESGDEAARTLAAVLFGLASQQGDEEASEALSRVVDFDVMSRNVQDEESFLASPVVRVAQAALSYR